MHFSELLTKDYFRKSHNIFVFLPTLPLSRDVSQKVPSRWVYLKVVYIKLIIFLKILSICY